MQTHVFSRCIHHICFIFFLIIVSRRDELSMRGAIRPAPRFCSSLLSPELDTDTKIYSSSSLFLCFFLLLLLLLLLRSLPTLKPNPEPAETLNRPKQTRKPRCKNATVDTAHSFGSQAHETPEQEATVTAYWIPTEDEGEATRRRCRPSDAIAIAAAASKASGRQQGWKRTNVGGKAAKNGAVRGRE